MLEKPKQIFLYAWYLLEVPCGSKLWNPLLQNISEYKLTQKEIIQICGGIHQWKLSLIVWLWLLAVEALKLRGCIRGKISAYMV